MEIFQPILDDLRFSYEIGKKQLGIFAAFSWIRPESPQYFAEFTTMCNTILRNTAISSGIDHKLVKNTPNAARVGHK